MTQNLVKLSLARLDSVRSEVLENLTLCNSDMFGLQNASVGWGRARGVCCRLCSWPVRLCSWPETDLSVTIAELEDTDIS